MHRRAVNIIERSYVGGVLTTSLLIGGYTRRGAWTDYLLEIMMLPILYIGVSHFFRNGLSPATRALVLFVIGLIFIQFLPFTLNNNIPLLGSELPKQMFWTASPSRALESALFMMPVLGIFLYSSALQLDQQLALMRFIFIGIFINMLVAIILLSYSSNVSIDSLLPYNITSGLFANENHFSAMLFMSIPIFAWRFMVAEQKTWLFLTISLFITAVLFAVGSLAGMSICGVLIFISYLMYKFQNKIFLRNIILSLLILVAMSAIAYLATSDNTFKLDEIRLVIFKTTINAIKDHWLTGTGLGSFLAIYPIYEAQNDILTVYANNAHNDYLELLLELGIIVVIPIVWFMVLLANKLFSKSPQSILTLTLIAIAFHSLFDYPLRTFGVATLFAFIAGIISSQSHVVKRGDYYNKTYDL